MVARRLPPHEYAHLDPAVRRELVAHAAADGVPLTGILYRPPRVDPPVVVLAMHPRGDFSRHYLAPPLVDAGYAFFGATTRYLNHDADALHERLLLDVAGSIAYLREAGFHAVVLLGNSGGGSLMALAQRETQCGDGFVAIAAHPGEGVFMMQAIDPSVADEADPFSAVPELDMYDPRNGWRPWPEPCRYERDWLARYREAQRARVARIDAIAREAIAAAERAAERARAVDRKAQPDAWRTWRKRAVHQPTLVIYRTLADPAYLDLTIDPDDRPLGSLFAFPDPFDANYARLGLARTMTPRGWLSTWSGLSSHARLADTMPHVKIPTLILHPTADTEIRVRQALEIRDQAGAEDLSYHELKGAPHYLEGHRRTALERVVDWLRARFP